MEDDNFGDKDSADPEGYDLDAELRKSSPLGNAGWWLWSAGCIVAVLSVVAGFFAGSFVVLFCGLCFSGVFFGLDAVVDKLNEVFFEVRRK